MSSLQELLNDLYRNIDAEGGTRSNRAMSYDYGIQKALVHLEAAGFSEGKSEAAAHIDTLEARVTALEVADINLDSAEDLLAFHVGSEEVLAAGGRHVIVMNAEDFATALEAVRTARAALKRGEG